MRIRGIECSICTDYLKNVLLFLSGKPFNFYVDWCVKIDGKHMIMPESSRNYPVTAQELQNLANASIWELTLLLHPSDPSDRRICTYEDFIASSCICCLIFYDCAMLDIYIKDDMLREELRALLLSLGAEDLTFITDESDQRTGLC